MDLPAVEQYLKGLQQSICDELSTIDGSAHFEIESWERPEGGGGISRVLVDGNVFEKGGVNFSYVEGGQMPGSATQHRPELAGRSFKAMGVSLVMHPQNPYVPTAHANVRCFVAEKEGGEAVADILEQVGDAVHPTMTEERCIDAMLFQQLPELLLVADGDRVH